MAYSKPSVLTLRHKSRFFSRKSISDLQISGAVDLPDLVSLVFLMSESHQFHDMYDFLKNLDSESFVAQNFFDIFNQFLNWERKITEALECLNNKMALFLLNIPSSELSVDAHTTYCLNASRVILYRILEGLNEVNGRSLIDQIKSRGAPMPNRDLPFLELYFMFWHVNEFLNVDNQEGFDLVAEALRNIGKPDLANTLGWHPQFYNRYMYHNNFPIEIYTIQDEKNTGLCLIINQVRYGGKDSLHDRESSLVDVDKLKRLMASLNFAVIALENLSSPEFCESIKRNVMEHFIDRFSIFMLVVMAHGRLGYVMCPESTAHKDDKNILVGHVMVKDIQNCIFDCDILKGKPKIFILNACRGQDYFTTKNYFETEMAADDAKPQVHSQVDIITCYSALPDFVSLRDKEKGAFFINVFCDVLSKRPEIEICELFTLINARLMQPTPALSRGFERGHRGDFHKFANPLEFNSSLTKKLYFKLPT